MSKGIQIPLIADVSKFIRGTDDVGKALDGVVDSLDVVAREGKTTTSTVERSLGDVETAGKDASDTLEKRFRTAFDSVKTDAKTTGTDVSTHMKKGAKDAGDAVGTFKDEARQNFAETASSFDGTIGSAVDGLQGTIGGLAGSLGGPIALVAGLAAGVGGAMFTSFQENSVKVKAEIRSMYDDMLESGMEYLSKSYVQTNMSDILNGADDAIATMDQVKTAAEAAGVSQSLALRALSGDIEAQREMYTKIGVAMAENDTIASMSAHGGQQREMLEYNARLETLRLLDAQKVKTEAATDAVVLQRDAVSQMSGVTQSELRAIKGGYDNIPREIVTTVRAVADTTQAQRDLDLFARQSYTTDFRVRVGKAVI